MDGTDYLLTCAEIGVALAGFAALIVAVRQRSSETIPMLERRMVAGIIERGLMVSLLALLPVLLQGFEIRPRIVWAISSGIFLAYGAVLTVRHLRHRTDPDARRLAPSAIATPIFAFGLLVLASQALHALGVGLTQSVWWFAVAVTWLLVSGGYTFAFVFRSWVRGH